jgi:hypothetical protein
MVQGAASPPGHAGAPAPQPQPGEVPWMGRHRASMDVNPLIAKAELGRPRKTTFSSPEPGHAFGLKLPSDAEGARQGAGRAATRARATAAAAAADTPGGGRHAAAADTPPRAPWAG